ncbi:hypothetical protein LCGC14_1246570, partial [marine sediment metagenome]
GYETVWVENDYFSPDRFSGQILGEGGLHIDYMGGENQKGGKFIKRQKVKQTELATFSKDIIKEQADAVEAGAERLRLTAEGTLVANPPRRELMRWKQGEDSIEIIVSDKFKISDQIKLATLKLVREHKIFPGAKMAILWGDQLIYPNAIYWRNGKPKSMEDKLFKDVLKLIGYDSQAGERKLRIVPLSKLSSFHKQQILTPELGKIFPNSFYLSQEAQKFYNDDFRTYFKLQFEQVLGNEENGRVFEEAYSQVKGLSSIVSLTRGYIYDIISEKQHLDSQSDIDSYLKSGNQLGNDVRQSYDSVLKSYFESFFKANDFQGNSKKAYLKLVDSLYALFVRKRFQNTEGQEIYNIFENRQEFAILTYIMEKGGIEERIGTQAFVDKLDLWLKDDSNKAEFKRVFMSEEGKQRIMESFLCTFLENPMLDKLIVPTYNWQASLSEVRYNLFRLPIQINSFFKELLEKVETDSEYTMKDLFNQKVYSSIKYNPTHASYKNNLLLKGISSVSFYGRSDPCRLYDGLAIIEIMGTSLATKIKSTTFENIFSEGMVYNLPNMLSNDGLSSLINAYTNSKDSSMKTSLKAQIITLAGPIISYNVLSGFLPYATPETLANVRALLKIFFSKEISKLDNKLEDHELFLVQLVKLINQEITIKYAAGQTVSDMSKFAEELFSKDDFKDKIFSLAGQEFASNHFIEQLEKYDGFKQLLNLLKLNLESLIVTLPPSRGGPTEPDILLSLSYDYDPHFKSNEKLSRSDFPSHIYAYDPSDSQGVTLLSTDALLEAYRIKYKGALKAYHIKNLYTDYGKLVLVPTSLIGDNLKEVPTTMNVLGGMLHLEEGWQDRDTGIVYHNIFIADEDGYKLHSKFIFNSDEQRIHKNPFWAENFIDFDFNYDLFSKHGIVVYQSRFIAAYTINRGDTSMTGLTYVLINIEDTPSSPNPLPLIETPKRSNIFDANIIPLSTLLPEWSKKIESYSMVLNQLAGLEIFKQTKRSGTQELFIDNNFLNLQNDGIVYTIEGIKTTLNQLGLTDVDFPSITRGMKQADGSFQKSPASRFNFYASWSSKIKNDLSNGGSVFGSHPGLGSMIFTGIDNQFAEIDAALQDVFGYIGFICLLSGIMTFAEDSGESSGYRVDFSVHSQIKQAELLNDFIGRGIYDHKSGDFSSNYLSSLQARLRYFTGIFIFGSKIVLVPLENGFIDNYYSKFLPSGEDQFGDATNAFLNKHFLKYLGESGTIKVLNEKLILGRTESFELIRSLSIKSPLKSVETAQMNFLWKDFILPLSESSDHSSKLRGLSYKNKGFVMHLKYGPEFGVSTINLNSAIDNSMITSNTYYSWLFNENLIGDGASNYYLDFDLVFKQGLDEKITSTFKKLKEIFALIPDGNTFKAKIYGRTTQGIDSRYTISSKPGDFTGSHFPNHFIRNLFGSDFDNDVIEIDLRDGLSESLISLITLMVIEPNAFINIKVESGTTLTPGDNLLNMDIYGIYDDSILSEGSVARKHRIGGASVWSETGVGAVFTQEKFNELKVAYDAIIQYKDIKYFNGFHNHQRDNGFSTMFDYVKAKIYFHFKMLGGYIDASKLTDLRTTVSWAPK